MERNKVHRLFAAGVLAFAGAIAVPGLARAEGVTATNTGNTNTVSLPSSSGESCIQVPQPYSGGNEVIVVVCSEVNVSNNIDVSATSGNNIAIDSCAPRAINARQC